MNNSKPAHVDLLRRQATCQRNKDALGHDSVSRNTRVPRWVVLSTAGILFALAPVLFSREPTSTAFAVVAASLVIEEGSLRQTAAIEVVELHVFLADWFSARLPKTKAAFARFEDAIASDFVIVGPDGSASERTPVIAAVYNDWGRWREDASATIDVKNVQFRQQGSDLLIVTYEEWQHTVDGTTARTSSVVLRESEAAALGLEWVHLHETWLQDDTDQE